MKPVALVTGGARGIGRGIVMDLARDHAVATTFNSSTPDEATSALENVHFIQADLADPAKAQLIIDQTIAHFGQLDIIVNNAGAIETDDQDSGLNFAVNTMAPMAVLDAALAHLNAGASVINISSVNATLPAMGALSYSASKAALETWTRGAAKTLGPKGIRVNAIAPGAIEREESPRPPELIKAFVDMTALGRSGTPDDIAKVVRFLASDAAGFITGETITVSGGYRL